MLFHVLKIKCTVLHLDYCLSLIYQHFKGFIVPYLPDNPFLVGLTDVYMRTGKFLSRFQHTVKIRWRDGKSHTCTLLNGSMLCNVRPFVGDIRVVDH